MPRIIIAIIQQVFFLYLGMDENCLVGHIFPNVKYFVWYVENPQYVFVSCDLSSAFSSGFLT